MKHLACLSIASIALMSCQLLESPEAPSVVPASPSAEFPRKFLDEAAIRDGLVLRFEEAYARGITKLSTVDAAGLGKGQAPLGRTDLSRPVLHDNGVWELTRADADRLDAYLKERTSESALPGRLAALEALIYVGLFNPSHPLQAALLADYRRLRDQGPSTTLASEHSCQACQVSCFLAAVEETEPEISLVPDASNQTSHPNCSPVPSCTEGHHGGVIVTERFGEVLCNGQITDGVLADLLGMSPSDRCNCRGQAGINQGEMACSLQREFQAFCLFGEGCDGVSVNVRGQDTGVLSARARASQVSSEASSQARVAARLKEWAFGLPEDAKTSANVAKEAVEACDFQRPKPQCSVRFKLGGGGVSVKSIPGIGVNAGCSVDMGITCDPINYYKNRKTSGTAKTDVEITSRESTHQGALVSPNGGGITNVPLGPRSVSTGYSIRSKAKQCRKVTVGKSGGEPFHGYTTGSRSSAWAKPFSAGVITMTGVFVVQRSGQPPVQVVSPSADANPDRCDSDADCDTGRTGRSCDLNSHTCVRALSALLSCGSQPINHGLPDAPMGLEQTGAPPPGCQSNEDCESFLGDDEICDLEACECRPCENDEECGQGMVCRNETCVEEQECEVDEDCEEGDMCTDGECTPEGDECGPGLPACPAEMPCCSGGICETLEEGEDCP